MSQLEVERKYALNDGQDLPTLADVVTPGRVAEFDLVATYYDTPDLRLNSARVTIRRRTGGHDDGWHLKLPGTGADERIEVHARIDPVAPDTVPAEFWDRVEAQLDGAPLVPVAVLHTHRREQELLNPEGIKLALSCIDDVRTMVAGASRKWREAEVELVAGDPGLLDAIESRLAAAGIKRAAIGSKVARALADRVPQRSLDGESTAGEVVLAYLVAQVGSFQRWCCSGSGMVTGEVHDGRVALRRLRSALKTYRSLFAKAPVRSLRAELRWFSVELSPVRDAEVISGRLMDGFHFGDAYAEALLEDFRQWAGRARFNDFLDGLDSERLAKLLVLLMALVAEPPFNETAGRPAGQALAPLWQAAVAEVQHRLPEADSPDGTGAWHRVRKAAKAARYGAEVLVAVVPELDAGRAAWEQVTEALGAVQDAVITHRELGELALAAAADGHPGALPADLWRHQEELLATDLARGRDAVAAALAAELPANS